jgi:formate/nitrite transporter FocA (FNT family)
MFMGLSALGNAIAMAPTPAVAAPTNTTLFVAKMFDPLGFIVVILGRSQLFTENTLYPVAQVLAEKNTSGSPSVTGPRSSLRMSSEP